jgi:Mg-chelatase subunit ChlD
LEKLFHQNLEKGIFMADEKVIEKIRKLFAIAEGVSNENNSDEIREAMANEAMSAARMAENLLLKFKLSKADVIIATDDETEEIIPQFGYTFVPDFIKRANAKAPTKRKVWFEQLAQVVAQGYFCKSAPRPNSREVIFYGLDMDREIAIYVFQRLAESAHELSKIEWKKAERVAGLVNFETFETNPKIDEEVFLQNFHRGFREAIAKTYVDRLAEEDERAQNIFEKAQEETRQYFNSVRDSSAEREWPEPIELEENSWAIAIGVRAGNKISTRIDSITENKNALEKSNNALNEKTGIVWLVIDRSGSMYGESIRQAKFGAIDYAKQAVLKNYSVGVIQFDHAVDVVVPPQKEITISWHNAVSKISAGGSTNLTDALKQAKSRFPSSRVKRIICVITDGMPDNTETALSAAAECKKAGIEIMAIGTDGARQDFLDKLTDMKGIKVSRDQLQSGISNAARLLLPA